MSAETAPTRTLLPLAEEPSSCACCAPAESTAAGHVAEGAVAGAESVAEIGVAGMTCANCVRHVSEELQAIDGVARVDVSLVAGGVSTVTVTSTAPLDAAVIDAAVAEAGYEVAR